MRLRVVGLAANAPSLSSTGRRPIRIAQTARSRRSQSSARLRARNRLACRAHRRWTRTLRLVAAPTFRRIRCRRSGTATAETSEPLLLDQFSQLIRGVATACIGQPSQLGDIAQLAGELDELVLGIAVAQVGTTPQTIHVGHGQAFAGLNSRGKEKTKVSLAVVTG